MSNLSTLLGLAQQQQQQQPPQDREALLLSLLHRSANHRGGYNHSYRTNTSPHTNTPAMSNYLDLGDLLALSSTTASTTAEASTRRPTSSSNSSAMEMLLIQKLLSAASAAPTVRTPVPAQQDVQLHLKLLQLLAAASSTCSSSSSAVRTTNMVPPRTSTSPQELLLAMLAERGRPSRSVSSSLTGSSETSSLTNGEAGASRSGSEGSVGSSSNSSKASPPSSPPSNSSSNMSTQERLWLLRQQKMNAATRLVSAATTAATPSHVHAHAPPSSLSVEQLVQLWQTSSASASSQGRGTTPMTAPTAAPTTAVTTTTTMQTPSAAPGPPRKVRGRTSRFPKTLHQVLLDLELEPPQASATNGQRARPVASFSPDGKSFAIHNLKEFFYQVGPTKFKMSSFASFQRQVR